ncbi:MAG: hypothetical protein ACF8TS_07570 [Maioricimonas sp. JB049]
MRYVLLLIGFGIVAALGSAHVAAHYGKSFTIPVELQKYNPPYADEVLAKLTAAERVAARKNAARVGGTVGGLFAAMAALAVAVATGRGMRTGWRAVVLGLFIGAALGAGGGVLNQIIYAELKRAGNDPFVMTALSHGAMWVGVAIAFALTTRLAAGSRGPGLPHAAGVLVVCAGIHAALYPFLAAAFLPLSRADQPVPEGNLNVLLWIGLPALLFNMAAGRMLAAKAAARAAEDAEGETPATPATV